MIRNFAAWLIAAALMVTGALPAQASHLHLKSHHGAGAGGGGSGSSPDVLPGAVAANTTFNTITPAQHGSSGDSAYNMRGFCRFTQVPLVEVGQSGVNGTRQIGVVCAHAAGDSEVAAGIASNIDHVDVRIDGGAWYTITGPTSDADAGGITDWNFTVNSQNFADGLHQADFRAVPTIGPDIIMEGPLEDANHYATTRMDAAMISDGTGSAPGNVLTVVGAIYNVNAIAGVSSLIDGYSLSGTGVAPNTFIDKTNADDATYTGTGALGTYHLRGPASLAGGAVFTATISGTTMTVTSVTRGTLEKDDNDAQLFGVGVTPGTVITTRPSTGQTGTYTISPSQTVSTPTVITQTAPMVAGNERSFYFITDFHNTLGRGTHVVYAAKTGSDSNSGLDAAHPKLNPFSALAVITSQDTNATKKGQWGGVVCLMDGGAWTSDAGTGSQADYSRGFVKYQSADKAPCVHPGDVGHASLTFNTSFRTWGGAAGTFQRVWYNHMTMDGTPGTLNSSLATQLVAQDTLSTSRKLGEDNGQNGILGSSGIACLETQIMYSSGGCGTQLVRNTTVTYHNDQAFHNTEVVLNSTESGGGPNFFFTSGIATAGSPVITGVTVPAGYNISDLFNVAASGSCASSIGCIGVAQTPGGSSCLPDGNTPAGVAAATIIAIDDVNHTITTDQNARCSATGELMFPLIHGDIVQMAVNTYDADVYWANNTGGAVSPGCEQGFFIEQHHVSGIYFGHNHFENNPACGMTNLFLAGGNDNVIGDHNAYAGSTGGRLDTDGTNEHHSDAETFVGDTCTTSPGGTIDGSGTRIRRKAAASSACYTSQ